MNGLRREQYEKGNENMNIILKEDKFHIRSYFILDRILHHVRADANSVAWEIIQKIKEFLLMIMNK